MKKGQPISFKDRRIYCDSLLQYLRFDFLSNWFVRWSMTIRRDREGYAGMSTDP